MNNVEEEDESEEVGGVWIIGNVNVDDEEQEHEFWDCIDYDE